MRRLDRIAGGRSCRDPLAIAVLIAILVAACTGSASEPTTTPDGAVQASIPRCEDVPPIERAGSGLPRDAVLRRQ